MIAIIAAVADESRLLRQWLFPCEVRRCGRRDLYWGNLFGRRIALMHCGVGKANAAATATLLLEQNLPSLLIAIGCAGAYPDSSLAIGDLVLASEELYADEGVITGDGFRDFASLGFPLLQENGATLPCRFPIPTDLLASARPFIEQSARDAGCKLLMGPLVTVSTCSGTLAAGRDIARRTGGVAENMEGAAIAQICREYGVPFLEIRGIANRVENRDLATWDLPTASRNAQQAVRALLQGWSSPPRRA